MKIWTFTTVKNEDDIIESFVRYNMNICDGMVISDNCSNDNTLKILKDLKEEGYNIDILVDKNSVFDQTSKRNELLNYTIKKYKPDFIFPIDADEFICTTDNLNPRKVIEQLDDNFLYKYKMRNYVVEENKKDELFIPKKITLLRNEIEKEKDYGCNYKCFISKKIYKRGVFLETGSHSASYLNKNNISTKINDNLYIAHFPIRSKEQLMNKVIIGRLNHSSFHDRNEGLGWHQYMILDEIIKNGTISNKMLINLSKYYSVQDKKTKIMCSCSPINLSFCNNIDIKYSEQSNKKNILSNTIKVSLEIINRMRDSNRKNKEEINKMKYKINSYKNAIDTFEKEKNYYKEELNKVLNSKTWRLKEKLVGLLKIKR